MYSYVAGEDRLVSCFREIAETIQSIQRGLTPREQIILTIGLSASHAEEALVVGDTARAVSHFEKVLRLSRSL